MLISNFYAIIGPQIYPLIYQQVRKAGFLKL